MILGGYERNKERLTYLTWWHYRLGHQCRGPKTIPRVIGKRIGNDYGILIGSALWPCYSKQFLASG